MWNLKADELNVHTLQDLEVDAWCLKLCDEVYVDNF